MMSISPFSALAESISPSVIQGFVLAMLALIVIGTVVQMIHHKNVTYFFNNAKKAKLAAERELGVGEKTATALKTVHFARCRHMDEIRLKWRKPFWTLVLL